MPEVNSKSIDENNNNNNDKNSVSDSSSSKKGSLTVVGTGIQSIRQITPEAKEAIVNADKVLFLVYDPVTEAWIRRINPSSESLRELYIPGRYRPEIYKEMTSRILSYVRTGLDVCSVFYGHPGIFVDASHKSISLALSEGFDARMLPGISSEDCLFADLRIDPASHGCQTYEATEFLLLRRKFDTSSHLILWQIGFLGYPTYDPRVDKGTVQVLVDFLIKHYGPNHEVVIYQASEYAICRSIIQRQPLSLVAEKTHIDHGSTLYVPPKKIPSSSYSTTSPSQQQSIDYAMAKKLGYKAVNFNFSARRLFHLKNKESRE